MALLTFLHLKHMYCFPFFIAGNMFFCSTKNNRVKFISLRTTGVSE